MPQILGKIIGDGFQDLLSHYGEKQSTVLRAGLILFGFHDSKLAQKKAFMGNDLIKKIQEQKYEVRKGLKDYENKLEGIIKEYKTDANKVAEEKNQENNSIKKALMGKPGLGQFGTYTDQGMHLIWNLFHTIYDCYPSSLEEQENKKEPDLTFCLLTQEVDETGNCPVDSPFFLVHSFLFCCLKYEVMALVKELIALDSTYDYLVYKVVKINQNEEKNLTILREGWHEFEAKYRIIQDGWLMYNSLSSTVKSMQEKCKGYHVEQLLDKLSQDLEKCKQHLIEQENNKAPQKFKLYPVVGEEKVGNLTYQPQMGKRI